MLHGTHKGGWISSCQALAMLNQLFQDGWSLGTHIIYPHGPWIMRVSWNGARRTGPVTCGPSLCVWTLCLPASRHLFHSELAARGEPKTTGGAKGMLSNPRSRPSKCCGNNLASTRQDLHLGSVLRRSDGGQSRRRAGPRGPISLDHRVDTVAPSIIVSTLESSCLKHRNTRRHGLISEI